MVKCSISAGNRLAIPSSSPTWGRIKPSPTSPGMKGRVLGWSRSIRKIPIGILTNRSTESESRQVAICWMRSHSCYSIRMATRASSMSMWQATATPGPS